MSKSRISRDIKTLFYFSVTCYKKRVMKKSNNDFNFRNQSNRSLFIAGLMIRYGGSIREDSCGDGGSILFLRITATLAFNPIIVYSTYILHIMSTSLP